jgi:hypothetical protein
MGADDGASPFDTAADSMSAIPQPGNSALGEHLHMTIGFEVGVFLARSRRAATIPPYDVQLSRLPGS